MMRLIPGYLGDEDMASKHVPLAVVQASTSTTYDAGWPGFLFRLAMMVHCFPMTKQAQGNKERWDELKRRGHWPPPMRAALVPYVVRNADNEWVGPPQLHTHPNSEEIVSLIYEAMAEGQPFEHTYIWDEVDSDYSFG